MLLQVPAINFIFLDLDPALASIKTNIEACEYEQV